MLQSADPQRGERLLVVPPHTLGLLAGQGGNHQLAVADATGHFAENQGLTLLLFVATDDDEVAFGGDRRSPGQASRQAADAPGNALPRLGWLATVAPVSPPVPVSS